MRRHIGPFLWGLAIMVLALAWAGGHQFVRAQVVTTETVTLALDSVLVGGARPPAPIGHAAFEVTLTPGAAANTLELRATDADGFAFVASYTSRGPN